MEYLQWHDATMTWAPEITNATGILRVPASINGYAAVLLEESLPRAIAELSQKGGEVLEVKVEAGDNEIGLGQIVIAADQLTERFNAEQLRRKVDELVNEAHLEGDALAERDQKRAERFLEELAQNPAQRS